MISTKELLEWREQIIATKENAERLSDNYDEKMVAYYEDLLRISTAHLALIERLIEQSRENEKEDKK